MVGTAVTERGESEWDSTPAPQPQYTQPTVEPTNRTDTAKRPTVVTSALTLSYLGAAFMTFVGLVLVIASAEPSFVAGVAEGLGVTGLAPGAVVAIGLYSLLVGGIAVVLTEFARRGRNFARMGLIAGGMLAIVKNVGPMLAGNVLAILVVMWIASVVVLLLSPASDAWYRQGRQLAVQPPRR